MIQDVFDVWLSNKYPKISFLKSYRLVTYVKFFTLCLCVSGHVKTFSKLLNIRRWQHVLKYVIVVCILSSTIMFVFKINFPKT